MNSKIRLAIASLGAPAILAALLTTLALAQSTATGPSGGSYHVYASAAAATSACPGGAGNVAYVQTPGAGTYVATTAVQTAKGVWTCLADAITAGFKPASCPSPDMMVWVDPNAKKYWTENSSGYGKGAGGYACRTFAITIGYTLGLGAGDFTAYGKPDAVTGCNPPNVVVWVSVDNKNAVSLTDPAAGKGNGGYTCSDTAISKGYKFLLDASTPEAANCKPPDVAVWFNRNENNYFAAGSDGYKTKVGSGAFVCLKDALALGGKDASQGIIGGFSADKLNCTPSLNVPVYVPHGSPTFLTLHDPQAPKSAVADGVGLWMCSNYAGQHGRTLAKAWKKESDAQCPGDVVVWAGDLNFYEKKGQPNYANGLGYYTCLVTAQDLGMNRDDAVAIPTGGPTLYDLDVACRKAGDQLVYRYVKLDFAIPIDDPSLNYSAQSLKSFPAALFTPGLYQCASKMKSDGWKVANLGFTSATAAQCGDAAYWVARQERKYYRPTDQGYGTGSGFYECRDNVLREGINPQVAQAPPEAPKTCTASATGAKNTLHIELRNGFRCTYDLDKVTIDPPYDTNNPFYPVGYAVHHDGTADLILPFGATGLAQFGSSAQLFGQYFSIQSGRDLDLVIARYKYLKSQQKP